MVFQNEMYKIMTSNNHIMLNVTFLIFLLTLVVMVTKFMINVFEMKINNKEKVIFLVSTFISVLTARLMVPIPILYRVICTIIITILVFFILKQNIEKSIISSSITNTILLIGEVLFSKILRFINSQNNIFNTLNSNLNFIIFSLIILFSLIVLIAIVNFQEI